MNGYPDSRQEAIEIGSQFYDTGKPCKYGHLSPRYVSSGCVKCDKERGRNRRVTETPEERKWRLLRDIWRQMLNRCYEPNNKRYKDYGGRGIKVEEYLWVFENFANYMGFKPFEGAQIDRIDNNGHYERGNMRWTTPSVNKYNQRKQDTNASGFPGVCWDKEKGKWRVRVGVGGGKEKHIGYYDTLYEAQLVRHEAEKQYWGEDMVKTPHPDMEVSK